MDHSDHVKRVKNPKENANPLSLITFLYTHSLFRNGFKKDLEDDDLYEVMKSCRARKCGDKLEHAYQAEAIRNKPSLLKVLWNCYGITYFAVGVLNLIVKLIVSTLEPTAISQLVAYFKPGQVKMTMNDALYYAGVLIGLKIFHTLFFPNNHLFLEELALKIRTGFSSLVYRKALKLSPKALEKTNLGNIITVISKDVGMFGGGIFLLNDLWVGTIQIIYICYLIYARIGISSAVGVIILASSIPVQLYVAKIISKLRGKMNSTTDKRLQETQESLSTIRIIKMYTWEKIFANRISETRRKEIKTLLQKGMAKSSLIMSSDFLGKLGFYAIVMLYIYLNTTVDAESIFYIMRSYLSLRHTISFMFTIGFSMVGEIVACVSRIEKVLMLDEVPDHIDKPDDEPQIDIRDATVVLKDTSILKNITLKLKAGLNIVTGQLGCGKSSLVKLILRDYPIESGEIRTRGRMSYASQDPWLFPATIRQNILFGEKYEYERYNKVIEVCALSYDLSILEKGDETVVQDRGMNLSKGQQARINLARSIYKDSDIYLIDDALTALDGRVQDHIFKECIEGFLKGKLVLLITHNARHISRSESVVILDNGAVKYIGKQQELSKELLQALEEEIHEYPPPTPQPGDTPKIDLSKEAKEMEVIDEKVKLITPPPMREKKQIYHEVKKSGGVTVAVYKKYVHFGGGFLLVLLMISLYFCSSFTDSTSQVSLTNWINHVSEINALKEKNFGDPTIKTETLFSLYFPANSTNDSMPVKYEMPAIDSSLSNSISQHPDSVPLSSKTITLNYHNFSNSQNFFNLTHEENKTYQVILELENIEHQASKALNFYTICLVASFVFEFVKQYAFYRFGTNASINIHKSMIQNVIFAKMSFFDTHFVGNILNRFSQDLTVVDERLPMLINMVVGSGFMCAAIVGMMMHVNWKFIVPALSLMAVLILMRYIYIPTARSLKRLEAATRSPIIGHLNSSMEGLTTVRAYKAQDILRNEFDKHQDVYTSAAYTAICARTAFTFYMDFCAILLIMFIITRFLFFDTDTLAGDVGLALTQCGSLTMILQFALMQLSEVESFMTSVERVLEYTGVELETSAGTNTPNWPSQGEIVYMNVSLKYTNSNEKVLNNINFKVKAKEKIGIVGRTGAGKSSIIATLFRLYQHEGTILIDDVDTNKLGLDYLRKHISIIPQDPIMFSGTIRTNIDPEKEFTDEEIWKVLHKVNLDQKIANLEINCDDVNFSSGERQLLSLGRAIIRRNKIVVLDEATANMDPETELMVQKAIDANFSDCTVFIIAHRLDCILNCNKVMVLNRGEIIEYDKPDVLLRNHNSTFSKMMLVAGAIGH